MFAPRSTFLSQVFIVASDRPHQRKAGASNRAADGHDDLYCSAALHDWPQSTTRHKRRSALLMVNGRPLPSSFLISLPPRTRKTYHSSLMAP